MKDSLKTVSSVFNYESVTASGYYFNSFFYSLLPSTVFLIRVELNFSLFEIFCFKLEHQAIENLPVPGKQGT